MFWRYLLFVIVLVSVPGFAQASSANNIQPDTKAAVVAASVPAIPGNPNKLMLLGAQLNGLAPDMKPWHLRANFQTFDADGKPKDQGVFEEWWDASAKWKVSYAGKEFHQVMYRNGDMGTRKMTGDSGWIPVQYRIAIHTLYEDFATKKSIEKANLRAADRKLGAVDLHCVGPLRVAPELMASEDIAGNPMLAFRGSSGVPTVCFNPDSAVVRVVVYDNGFSMIFDNVVQVDGRYIARDIWLRNGSLPLAHLTVSAIETLAKIEDSEFTAPASAVPVPAERYNSEVKEGRRTGGEVPIYPPLANSKSIQGRVVLEATITSTGDITDVQAISGPKELRQSALDAVKTWKYKPYSLNGKPVEMRTAINIVYTMR